MIVIHNVLFQVQTCLFEGHHGHDHQPHKLVYTYSAGTQHSTFILANIYHSIIVVDVVRACTTILGEELTMVHQSAMPQNSSQLTMEICSVLPPTTLVAFGKKIKAENVS